MSAPTTAPVTPTPKVPKRPILLGTGNDEPAEPADDETDDRQADDVTDDSHFVSVLFHLSVLFVCPVCNSQRVRHRPTAAWARVQALPEAQPARAWARWPLWNTRRHRVAVSSMVTAWMLSTGLRDLWRQPRRGGQCGAIGPASGF